MTNFIPKPQGILNDKQECISYGDAINMLDTGEFDKDLKSGFILIGVISEGCILEHFSPTVDQRVSMWRWMVAACFINEQLEKYGTVEVKNEDGGVGIAAIYVNKASSMAVYPSAERIALSNHVERIAIENYGREKGLKMAIMMYHDFISISSENGTKLSDIGRERMNMLQDDFLNMLKDKNMPSTTTVH
ncbi:MAG: hypothetical protein ACL7AX_02660 [Candidatus Arsenophonus phytopathogenicus]